METMPLSKKIDIFNQVNTLCREDEEFRNDLKANPRGVLTKRFGFQLKTNIELLLLEDTEDLNHVVIHDMSQDELNQNPEDFPASQRTDFQFLQKTHSDPEFQQKLMKEPTPTLEDYFGVSLPKSLTLKTYIENPNTQYLVIPHLDANGDELTDDALEAVAGGSSIPLYLADTLSKSCGNTTTAPGML